MPTSTMRGSGAPVAADAPGDLAGTRAAPGVRLAGRIALLLGLLGVGYRLAMLLVEVPPANSDEATSGLVALHLVQGRGAPLFFYGQYYMGALESYLAAPIFALAGASTLALRLPTLLLYAAFLALLWQLTRRLYSPWLATVTVGLLALGSDRILKNQLIAGGGYPEMNPAGVLLVLLAVNLGLGAVRRRALAYAAWGLVAGLTLWDDWLVLPYVGAAGVLLLACGWRELRGRAGLAFAGGLLVGLVPIVAHNLTAAPEHRSLAIYANLSGGAAASWADRLYGGVLFGLPMGTGACLPGRCEPWQLWWGAAYPVLLVAAGVLAVRALRRAGGGRGAGGGDDVAGAAAGPIAGGDHGGGGIRAERVRQGGRLALVVGAALSLLSYATSSAAGNTPVESARYLSCLLISTPAVLWPLWSAASRARRRGGRGAALTRLAALTPLVALGVTMVIATGALIGHAPAAARVGQERRELVAELDRRGIDRFYGEYWTCNNLTFLTRERLVCAVIRDDLRPGWDRYLPYRAEVRRSARPAYVLPTGSALSRAVAAHLAAVGVPATVTTVAGYDIYQPAAPVRLPLP
ncbi:hypothetical protein AB0J86_09660 [Micromonospora sp. NPDC049559]|uniref:hypothetical protein n=1 Tax=Micromonospora sp. NPDC049559 TaxID=3155923 RepID=UPI003447CA77